jgi:fibronectin-binding autotransporter adhesin
VEEGGLSQTITGVRTASLSLTVPAYASPLTIAGTIDVSAGLAGLFGVEAASAWDVVNQGTVLASADEGTGISLAAGGVVSNASGALISGYDAGLVITGTAGTVMNAGRILAVESVGGTVGPGGHVEAIGVFLGAGGTVSNLAGGTIQGGAAGLVLAASTGANAFNAGVIAAQQPYGTAVRLGAGDALSNAAAGVITAAGTSAGAYKRYPYGAAGVDAAGGTVTNAGTIVATGVNAFGVELARGAMLANSGTVAGYARAIYGYEAPTATSINSLVNHGLITATGTGLGDAVRLVGNAAFTNAAGGVVASGEGGVSAGGGGTQTLINDGRIVARGTLGGNDAVGFYTAGLLSNAATGTISGGNIAAAISSGATLVNDGLISNSQSALQVRGATAMNAGTVTASAPSAVAARLQSGVLVNSGLLAGWNGVYEQAYAGAAGTIVNSGTISGAGGGATAAVAGVGVYLAGGYLGNGPGGVITGYDRAILAGVSPATVVNAGRIVSAGTSSAGAVELAPGSYLRNAAGATISASAGPGVLIATAGTLGTIVNAGTIIGGQGATPSLTTAASAGLVEVLPGGTFEGRVYGTELLLGGTAAATLGGLLGHAGSPGNDTYLGFSTVAFAPGATWAVGGAYGAFAYSSLNQGVIVRGFQAGDTITLDGLAATGYAFSGPFLTLTGGGAPVTLDLMGRLSSGTFGVTNEGTATVLTTDRTILPGAIATLTGDYGRPVRLTAPYYAASVTNAGTAAGGISAGEAWTLVNDGSVSARYGISFANGGAIVNAASHAIRGGADGIRNQAGALAIDNAGIIYGYAAGALGAAAITNEAGGTILGGSGVNGLETLVNAGTIAGTASAGVYSASFSGAPALAVTNLAGGVILGTTSGVDLSGTYATLLNQGVIAAGTATGAGLIVSADATIGNDQGGSIAGGLYGFEALSAFTLTNAGTIGADAAAGIGLGQRGGYSAALTNLAGGVISGVAAGVSLKSEGHVTNAGTIIASVGTGFYARGVAGAGLTLSNAAGGIIEGATLGVDAPGLLSSATIRNAGMIGATSAGGTAVAFGSGHRNELVAYAGAQFLGTILGGNPIGGSYVSRLVLATGSGVGTIANFSDFSLVFIDQGATWDVAGNTAALEGVIRGFMPGDTIDVQGINAGTVAVGGGRVTLLSAGTAAATLNMPTPLDATAIGVAPDGAGGVLLTATGPATPRALLGGTYGVEVYLDPAHYAANVTVTGAVLVNSIYSAMIEYTGHPWTVANQGRIINADTAAGVGLYLYNGGAVSNAAGATIAGGFDGVYIVAAASVVNAGLITAGTKGAGVNIFTTAASWFSNLAGGTIAAGYEGLLMAAPGTAINAGRISGTGAGVVIGSGGTLINEAGGQITGGAGVVFRSGGVLFDDGTIGGGVRLNAGGATRVVLAPTAVLAGYVGVYGSGVFGRYGQTLELGAGTLAGTLADFGSSIEAFGTVVFDPGSKWTVAGSVAGLGAGEVADTGTPRITFEGFTVGDTIDIAGFSAGASAFAGGLLTLVGTQGSVTGNQVFSLPGAFATSDFRVAGDGNGGTDVFVVACFAAATRLLGTEGEIAVEALRAGQRLMTQSGRLRPVRWVGRRRLVPARHPRPWDVNPVRVRAGAFAPDVPHRDLLLSPDHAVFVDGRLVPVRYLVNGATVVQEAAASVTYFHVELDTHDVVLAEGLACESYLDTGNRQAFEAEGEVAMLHPEFGREAWIGAGCAGLVLEGEPVVAARAALLARAGALGWRLEAAAPLIEVDGRPVAVARRGRRHAVLLPEGARLLRIVSLSGRPGETAAGARDMRRLGVALARLALDGRRLAPGDPRLGAGWHDPEPEWRWTDGDAEIDVRGACRFTFDLMVRERGWVREAEDIAAPPAGRAARSRG